MTLFGNRVLECIIKERIEMRLYWVRLALNPMTGVLIGIEGDTRRTEGQVMVEAEIGVPQP